MSSLKRLKRPSSPSGDESESNMVDQISTSPNADSSSNTSEKRRRKRARISDEEDGESKDNDADMSAIVVDEDEIENLADLHDRTIEAITRKEEDARRDQLRLKKKQRKEERDASAAKKLKERAKKLAATFIDGDCAVGKSETHDEDEDEEEECGVGKGSGDEEDNYDYDNDEDEDEDALDAELAAFQDDIVDDSDVEEGDPDFNHADHDRKSPVPMLLDEAELIRKERRKKMTEKERLDQECQEVEDNELGIDTMTLEQRMDALRGDSAAIQAALALREKFDDRFSDEVGKEIHAAILNSADQPITDETVVSLIDRMMSKFGFVDQTSTNGPSFSADSLFGGEFQPNELNIGERLLAYKVQYLVEIDELSQLCAFNGLLEGSFGEGIRSNLAQMQQAVHNFLQMKQAQLRNYNLQTVGLPANDSYVPSMLNNLGDDDKEMNRSQKLNIHVNEECRILGYVKSGRDLWEQNKTPEGYPKNSFKKKCTIRQMIYRSSKLDVNPAQWKNRTYDNGTVAKVEKDIMENEESTIPELKRDRCCWSFSDVFYDGSCDRWYEYGKERLPNKIAARDIPHPLTDKRPVGPDYYTVTKNGVTKYYDEDYQELPGKPSWISWMSIKTPVVDRIMIDQGWSRSVRKWFWVFMGRMAFPLGIENGGDNWQKAVLLYGKGGTGKSTLAKHFCQMATTDDIFDIESKGETTFALEAAVDPIKRWIWRILEVKGESNSLGSERYQKMVEGGMMGIPRKNKPQLDVDFDLPGIMCGNERLPFDDAQDSISRRTETWEFTKQVKQNTYLFKELFVELPNDLRKAVTGYRLVRKWVGMRDPHTLMGKYFELTKTNLKNSVDTTTQFINAHLEYNEKGIIPLDVFRSEFASWMQKNKKPFKNLTDEQIQNSVGQKKGVLMDCLDVTRANTLHELADAEDCDISMPDARQDVSATTVEQQFAKIYKVDAATGAHRDITIAANKKYIKGFKIIGGITEYGVEN